MTISPSVTQKYSLGPVKPWVENAAYVIGPQFGIKTIYGWRQSDPFPDHPSGHALDFMTPNKAAGDALAAYAVAHYKELGIKYVIWWHRYWSPSTGWEPYVQTSNPHTDHVHITFLDSPGAWTSSSGIVPISFATTTPSTEDETCAWKLHFAVVDTCVLSKVQLRVLIGSGLMLAGSLLAVTGVVLLLAYGLNQSRAASLLPPQVRRFL